MPEMEYRGWVPVAGLDVETDAAERLLTVLEQWHGDLGPVLGGTREGLEVVVDTNADRIELERVDELARVAPSRAGARGLVARSVGTWSAGATARAFVVNACS
jgi:hypothetical protein